MFFLRTSNAPTPEEDKDKSNITDWVVFTESESLDNLEGFVVMSIDNQDDRTSLIWQSKHIDIVDESNNDVRYWFQYEWVPTTQFIRLVPPPDEIQKLLDEHPAARRTT